MSAFQPCWSGFVAALLLVAVFLGFLLVVGAVDMVWVAQCHAAPRLEAAQD